MKKIVLSLICVFALFLNLQQGAFAKSATWVKCGRDMNCVRKASGFVFTINAPIYNIRAKSNLIEIKYPYDTNRDVYIRKSPKGYNNGDISGVTDNFPVSKQIKMKNGEKVSVRGYSRKFFVVLFKISNNYYSLYCKKGLKKKEVNELYNLVKGSVK